MQRAKIEGWWIGLLGLLSLCVLAGVFWRERTLILDPAFQLFHLLVDERLAIQVQRFGAAVVQFVPLLLAKSGAELSTVLKAYSLGFTLYPLVLALLSAWPVRRPAFTLAIALFYLLQQVHTFFWMQSELIQGCVYTLFLLGLVSRWPNPRGGLIVYAGLLVVIVYLHPLAIYPLLFGLVYLGWATPLERKWPFYGLFVLLGLILVYKYVIAGVGEYDSTALTRGRHIFQRLGHIYALTSTHEFVRRLVSTYYLLLPAYVAVGVYGRRMGKRRMLLLTFGAALVWLIIILTSFHQSSPQFYMESYYMVLGAIVVVPLVTEVLPALRPPWVVPVLLVVLLAFRVGQIVERSSVYQRRLAWLENKMALMQRFPEQRFVIARENAPESETLMDWAVPYETILLSAMEGPDRIKTLFVAGDSAAWERVRTAENGFPNGWGIFTYGWLNQSPYFLMRDTLPVREIR